MSNIKLFIISLVTASILFFVLYVMEMLVETTWLEHLYLGMYLGVDFTKHSNFGEWIPLPFVPWLFILTLVLNYLISVLLIYVFLRVFTKILKHIF